MKANVKINYDTAGICFVIAWCILTVTYHFVKGS